MTGAEQRVLAALGRALGKSGRGRTAVVCGGPMAGRVGIVLARRGWRVRVQADTADTVAGRDPQLDAAIDVLQNDVRDSQREDKPFVPKTFRWEHHL